MENTNKGDDQPSTESIGVTEMQFTKLEIISIVCFLRDAEDVNIKRGYSATARSAEELRNKFKLAYNKVD
jgi:hypothetical protein